MGRLDCAAGFGFLTDAAGCLAEHIRRHETTVTVHCELEHAILPFPSAREVVINVSKHARTAQVSMSLWVEGGMLHLCVADEGMEFDQASTVTNSSVPMFGLFSIRERMDALGGRMIIKYFPGRGTEIISEAEGRNSHDESEKAPDPLPAGPGASPMNPDRPQPAYSEDFPKAARTRVLLVDDHAMLRQGIRTVLEGYADIEVVGEATNGEQAVRLAKSLQPEIVVMDINMPGMDGIEATRRLKLEQPATMVIGLSVHNSWQVEEVMREAGAVAFLAKDAAIEQLHETIQQALRSSGPAL